MVERKHIQLLPTNVANKIAAGEVVERPASVVKELIENALDAGSTRVEVSIEHGGRKLISVSDNGCGMERDDALMCFEPQATSKIRDVDDIERIDTYGFRGEAIPSIAAVSLCTLRTCATGENIGTRIDVAGGVVQEIAETGFPQGTTFEVRDLFFNVPARRKFLKSYQTEQSHIRAVFILQALSHPDIGMKLRTDGRDVYNLAAGATLAERVDELFGSEFAASLREVNFTSSANVKVSGFVGLPTLTRADRGEQYIFVNHRAATAAVVPYALREAYPPLDGDRKPVVLLFIDVPPTDVDVNVHPTKREVRFRDSAAVRNAIIASVSQALGSSIRTPHEKDEAETLSPQPMPVPMPRVPYPQQIELPRKQSFGLQQNKTHDDDASVAEQWNAISDKKEEYATNASESQPLESDHGPWAWCRILGQIADGYVLLETDGGYVVLDPRAAHERVLYEKMLASIEGSAADSQRLLIPESVTLPPEDATKIRENLDTLKSVGFGIDAFGHGDVFIVDAIPAGIDSNDYRALLIDIAHGITSAGARRGVENWRGKLVALAVSHAAVPHTCKLQPEALESLVCELCATKMPYTCPRGKPTMLFTPLRELARKFGRE